MVKNSQSIAYLFYSTGHGCVKPKSVDRAKLTQTIDVSLGPCRSHMGLLPTIF